MSQRIFFTSTPRKRTYLWDTGQTILQTRKNQDKNPLDVNTPASRVYRVVLWESQDTGSSSKKKKRSGSTQRTSKKKQKETGFFSQNLDKVNSLKFSNSGICHNGRKKTGDNLGEEKENEEQKVKNENQHGKRAKYKLQVNKEIQKLFSQKFSDDKIKNPNHLQNINTSLELSSQENYSKKIYSFMSHDQTDNKTDKSEHLDLNKHKVYPQKKSAVVNSCDYYCNKELRETCEISNHDNTVKNCDQNCKSICRDAQLNDKDKCEDDMFLKSTVHIDEDSEHLIDSSDGHLEDKNNIGCLGNNKGYSNQNGADNMFDIWSLSKDIGQTRFQQLKKNMSNEKVTITKTVPTRKNDYSIFSKNKDLKKKNVLAKNSLSENKCYFQSKYSGSVKATTQPDSIVRTPETAQNSKKVLSSPYVHSSQVYEFPKSPDTGKEQLKDKVKKKRSSKMKKDLKNDVAVDQILKVISETKMEMESMREKMFKKKTKHK